MLAFRWTRSELALQMKCALGTTTKKEKTKERNQQISISVSLGGARWLSVETDLSRPLPVTPTSRQ